MVFHMKQSPYKESGLVSIVMPNYNKEEFVEQAITSCLTQSYPNIELIVIDDGSTDSSSKIIKNLASKDQRIHATFCRHIGKVMAINTGISKARGDFIKLWASDDVLKPNAIELLLKLIEGYDLVAHNIEVVNENMQTISKKIIDRKMVSEEEIDIAMVLKGVSHPSGCYFFRRPVLLSVFPIPEDATYEDWYIFLILILNKYNIHYWDESVGYYRQTMKNAYKGVYNFSKKTFFFRKERDLQMLKVFKKIIPDEYHNILENKIVVNELLLHSDFKRLFKSNINAVDKVNIFIFKYVYFISEYYAKIKALKSHITAKYCE